MCEKEKYMVLYEKKYKRDFMTEKELLNSGEIFSFGDGLYSYSSKIDNISFFSIALGIVTLARFFCSIDEQNIAYCGDVFR